MAAVQGAGRADTSRAGALTHDLYRRFGSHVHAYCLARLRSREEAEDAVQTTFMNVFRALERGTETREEQAWLFAIAKNVCGARATSAVRRLRLEAPSDLEVLQDVVPAPLQGRRDELFGLEDALESMPENQRRAILLREWQGLSYREIGVELGLTQTAVEMLIFRGRRTLAKALEQPAEAAQPKRRAARRLAQGLDLGGLFAAVKTLLTGGAAVKAVVVAVAASTATGAVSEVATKTLTHRTRTHAAHHVAAPSLVAAVAPVRSAASVSAPASRPAVRATPARPRTATRKAPVATAFRKTLDPVTPTLSQPAPVASRPAAVAPASAPPPSPAPAPARTPVAPPPTPTAPAAPVAAPPTAPPPSAAADDTTRKPGKRRGQAEGPPAPEPAPTEPAPQPQPLPPADTPAPPAAASLDVGRGNGHGNGKGHADNPPAPPLSPAPAPPAQAPPAQTPPPVTAPPAALPPPPATSPARGRGPDGAGPPGQGGGHGRGHNG